MHAYSVYISVYFNTFTIRIYYLVFKYVLVMYLVFKYVLVVYLVFKGIKWI